MFNPDDEPVYNQAVMEAVIKQERFLEYSFQRFPGNVPHDKLVEVFFNTYIADDWDLRELYYNEYTKQVG